MAEYISLYSGSDGNCSVIAEKEKFLIIDMGKTARATTNAIKELGFDLNNLQGILVSHEHTDHVAGLKVFLKKLSVPVYSNVSTLNWLSRNDMVPSHISLKEMPKEGENIGDFFVEGFDTPHDSLGCMGFDIHTKSGSRMTMATDLGHITEDILARFKNTSLAVLESNYNDRLLKENPNYPYYLKTRIASERGHLSNMQFAKAALDIIESGVEKFHLCHLSSNNNTPSTALGDFAAAAMIKGVNIDKLNVLKVNSRHQITPPTEF